MMNWLDAVKREPLVRRTLAIRLMLAIACAFSLLGCRGSSTPGGPIDTQLERFAEAGHQAYAEGHVEEAILEYRAAVRRAWAMDDPYESGTAAYNLAACMTSASRIAEAKDWLVDSRVEFYRADKSAGNTWLLESKIAADQACFEEARRCVQRAACSDPPCKADPGNCLCSPDDPCEDSCAMKIPCVGKHVKQRKAKQDCEYGYQAQVNLGRARIAAEQYDLKTACRCFSCACDLAKDICDHALHAELHDVAAMIHVAKGQHLQAGCLFDREAKSLRLSGNYREIPGVLELAAASYKQAGRCDLAADRVCRAARVYYGRGELQKSWARVQIALPLVEISNHRAARIRLALLTHEIKQSLSDTDEQIADADRRALQSELSEMEQQPMLLAPVQTVSFSRRVEF